MPVKLFKFYQDMKMIHSMLLWHSIYHSVQGLTNIVEALQRLKGLLPPIFLVYVNRQFESNKNFDKIFKESADSLQWTVVICNQINSSTETTFRIEKTSNPTHQDPISSMAIVEFLQNELKKKEYSHKIIYLY